MRQNLGSVFIINDDGYILTNNHVVEMMKDIKVALEDGMSYFVFTIRMPFKQGDGENKVVYFKVK